MNQQKTEQIAEKGFSLLQRMIAEEFVYLSPLIYAFDGQADEQAQKMGTNGETVFYDPVYLLTEMKNGTEGYINLKILYLHMVMHCLQEHIWNRPDGMKILWDQCSDIDAEMMRRHVVAGKQNQMDSEDLSLKVALRHSTNKESFLRELDASALAQLSRNKPSFQKAVREVSKNCLRDDHRYWKYPTKKREQEVSGGKGKKQVTAGITDSQSQEGAGGIQDKWKEMMEDMKGFLPDELEKSLLHGSQVGDGEVLISAAAQNLSSYRELLRKYVHVTELQEEDPESLDTDWYTLGMELYGNIPIIEYPETTEKTVTDEIVIAVDVSGSCDGKTASRFLRETCNILRDLEIGETGVHIRVMECDTQIQWETVIHGKEDIPKLEQRKIRGFGGTDFRPVFHRIRDLQESVEMAHVKALLYLSDGFGEFPDKKPDYDVVFILSETGAENMIPSWVQRLYLTADDLKQADREGKVNRKNRR